MHERLRVDTRRSRLLQQGRRGKGPVICWLSREQRLADNWPLLFAQDLALAAERGLVVVFCLQQEYLGATARHFRFMLDGLQELAVGLLAHGIAFRLLQGPPREVLPSFIQGYDAHCLVTDFNPLRQRLQWQQQVMKEVTVPVYEVDGHNIIPCWLASTGREFAAYTFRPKVRRLLPEFLTDFPQLLVHPHAIAPAGDTCFPAPAAGGDQAGQPESGEAAASRALAGFVATGLEQYPGGRNDPLANAVSGLSPYLHFGQLAPQRAALAVRDSRAGQAAKDAYLEELIVRRELADNFCYYCPDYDNFAGFPAWAQKTLEEHRHDRRDHVYGEAEFRAGNTHEPLWNCCQQMLAHDGRLHGYLRMYWAKKILEWSESPEEALRIGVLLNDSYAYDGRDPNGYTGLAWSIGGVHDRAWPERPVFGKIRYMNERGCRRKFKVDQLLATCRPE